MAEIVYSDIPRLLDWAAQKIGVSGFKADAKAFGVERDGELVAVVVYDCFSECDCNIHVASNGARSWVTRQVLANAFGYPFVELKLRRITGLVPTKKADAIKFNRHLGFKVEGLSPDAMPDDDILIMGMLRSECRWIPQEYRK